jgi:ABC-type amino acid transport substrate-binding protein
MTITINRRTLLSGAAGLGAASLIAMPARADSLADIKKAKKVRIAVAMGIPSSPSWMPASTPPARMSRRRR